MLRINRFLAIIALFLFAVILGSCGGGSSGGGSGGEPAENFTLTVDKFGEGVITSDIPGINCDNDCSESYQEGTSVVLTATDQSTSDYSFSSWGGCDSIINNTCTINMNRDRTLFPTFARELILKEMTKILDEVALQYLIDQQGLILYFDPQINSVIEINPSDIIIHNIGDGFIGKVTSVTPLINGQIEVKTTNATLADAVQEGTITFTKKLTQGDLIPEGAFIPAIKGASLREVDSSSTEFTIDFDTAINNIDGTYYPLGDFPIDYGNRYGRIYGQVTLEIETNFNVDYCSLLKGEFCIIKDAKFILNTTNINDINISLTGNYSGPILEPILIGTLPFGPFPFEPLSVSLEVNIYVGIDGNFYAEVTTGASGTSHLSYGLSWNQTNGWKKEGSGASQDYVVYAPTLSAYASITAYVRPEGRVSILGAGPFLNMDAYFNFSADADLYQLNWLLKFGLDAAAGLDYQFKILGIDFDLFSYDLLNPNLEWPIADGSISLSNKRPTATITSPSNGGIYNEGDSITFSGSGYDAEDGTLSGGSLVWTSSIDGQIGTGTSFTKTNLSVGTHTITLTATDSDGESGNASRSITVTESIKPLTITTTSLSSGTVGVSYPATNLSATGGKTTYSWSWSGNTPAGLTLDQQTGIISGIPTTADTYTFTIKVTDSSSPQQTASKVLSIVVNSVNTPTITSVTPSSGTQGQTLGVTILGANLTGATSVSFGAGITVNSFTVNSSTQITANISISSTATTGARNVSVTTPAGTGTGSGLFSVTTTQTFTLTVTKAGTGSGTVTSSPAGINCGGTCSVSFSQGISVTLTPTPAAGSAFSGWSGACSGTGTCTVTMNTDKAVTATFNTTTVGVLSVTPSDRLDSSGTEGGPFSPQSKMYTLSNTGGASINWTASKTQNWVSLSQTSGTLASGGSTTVTVTINNNANSLSPNNYVDIVTFTNTTNGNGNTTRTVNLTVNYSTPTITVGPTSLNLDAQVGTCDTAIFAIQHVSGTGPATGTVSANPNPPFSITAGSSFSVSNGSAVNVAVQFCPTSAGTFSGTATVSSSATFTGTNTVTLTGIGFNPTPTTGTIQVDATLNGSSWSGTVNYMLTGPSTLNGTSVPANFPSQPEGTWSLTYNSGGPTGAVLSSITPSTSQTLLGGGSITFTLNFTSAGCSEVEPNDSSLQANPLTLNVGCTGKISTSTDIDWFDVYVSSGTTISFTLIVPAGLDYDMALYGPESSNLSQHWLTESTNPAGQSETITYTTSADGYFAVQIYGYQGAYSTTATYTITRTQ